MEKLEKNEKKGEQNSQVENELNIRENSEKKQKVEKDNNDVPYKKVKAEERDTTGDTIIFKSITRKEIEAEKKRKANLAENVKLSENTENAKEVEGVKNTETKKDTENANRREIVEVEKEKLDIINEERTEPVVPQNAFIYKDISLEEDKANSEKKEKSETGKNQIMVLEKNNKVVNKAKTEENADNRKTEVDTKGSKTKSKKSLIGLLLLLVLILVILIVSTIFGVLNINSNKIVKGISVQGVELSNLTREEANQKLNNTINNNETNFITAKHGEYITEIHLEDIQGRFNTEVAVNKAFDIGRNENIFANNFKTIESIIKGNNIQAEFSYNEELLNKKIDEICVQIPDLATESSYVVKEDKVIIKNSKDGVVIKNDEFINRLTKAFITGEKSFELPIERVEKQEIDIDKIHNEIYKEPINASYTTNPFQIYKEEYGLDFAMSIDEAKKMVSEDKEEFEIGLKKVKPQITVADLGDEIFPDTLSDFTTTYGTGDTGRNTNIAIAARSINDAIVMPGEEFSYNDLIGECSTRTGYKESTIYLNGELSTGIGGGICQVSTTLYNAVLRANLEIVQRRNHSLGVTYVPAGHDAMVNIGTSDFKFKNNRSYPVKVVAFVGPGTITCQIKGIKQEPEYEVKLESRTIEKTDQRYRVETYKVLYLNGNVVSRTWLSTDTYKYH